MTLQAAAARRAEVLAQLEAAIPGTGELVRIGTSWGHRTVRRPAGWDAGAVCFHAARGGRHDGPLYPGAVQLGPEPTWYCRACGGRPVV